MLRPHCQGFTTSSHPSNDHVCSQWCVLSSSILVERTHRNLKRDKGAVTFQDDTMTGHDSDPSNYFSAAERTAIVRSKCQKKACAIQTCLAQVGYEQSRCQKVIDTYNSCSKQALDEAVAEAQKQPKTGNK